MKATFKYNINHHISLLPRHIAISDIEKILKSTHKISRDTFYRDRNLLTESDTSIPSDRLDIYASLFGCSVEELKNYSVKKGKTILEIVGEGRPKKKSVHKIRTGLK